MSLKKIRVILFDMDGVLVDAKDWHFEAFNETLSSLGYTPISYKDHLMRYDGLPTRKKLELLAQSQPIADADFEKINALKQQQTIKIAREKCRPTSIHQDAVQRLKAAGYKMAVCSNSVRASVDLLLSKTELLPFFDFTLSNEDVRQPKPHPEIYSSAIERFGVRPDEVLILEDNIHGIQAAKASRGHVMHIRHTGEVNYSNIMQAIAAFEGADMPEARLN